VTSTDGPLARLIAHRRTILLDFDGPVCSIFAGYPAPVIAEQLRDLVRRRVLSPPDIQGTTDPLAVLRLVDGLGNQPLTRLVARALQVAETTAVETAVPTPGAHEVIRAAASSGRRVGIVSNNSEDAINSYLTRHALKADVQVVAARYPDMPASLMKPHPRLLTRALDALGTQAADAVFVGDSVTDMQAAKALAITGIGYAANAARAAKLRRAGAEAVIATMHQLARAIRKAPGSIA